ncbi:hypothetical protein SLS53_007151 [Cytospora paraplurivora]|uniref:Uncharacterized protein n=1 Tax=Cytospora paraplurivora TaxID=2898453 RepID=A0AAN9YDZ8_9PEZI
MKALQSGRLNRSFFLTTSLKKMTRKTITSLISLMGPAHFIGIIAGTYIGLFSGNLKDGFGVNVNLFVVKGEFNFYLKNGSDVWIHQDYAITFGGRYEGDYKITHL